MRISRSVCFTLLALMVTASTAAAGAIGAFVLDVLAQVAASVITDAMKPSPGSSASVPVQAIVGTNEDRSRVLNIVSAITDTSTPLTERIGLYATSVDYFGAGVVGHDFIRKDRDHFEARWPNRQYTIRSVDEIAVAPDRTYAIARYTVDFKVSRQDVVKSGVSQYAVVIGSFHVQPRIHAIKEWVQHRR